MKRSSPGPVLFRQRRYGLDGREILVYKFRTMTVCEDGARVTQAPRNDTRVTPIGRHLRRWSLDELPQLINVLQGTMSLVGPRPHAVAHNEEYRKLIKRYMVRHKVLPGITGLAQVRGCRGETARVEDMEARVVFDLEYMRNWSPLLDLQILVATVIRRDPHGSGVLIRCSQRGLVWRLLLGITSFFLLATAGAALGSHDRHRPVGQEPDHLPARDTSSRCAW